MVGSEPSALYQLLQEQQEPFILHIYLSERGCPEKRLNSPNSFSCHPWISRKSVKWSARCMLNRSKEDNIPWCLKMITAVYNKLIPLKARPTAIKANNKDRRCISVTKRKAALDPVEEYQPMGLFNQREKEVSPDKNFQFHCWEYDKQLGRVSVPEDISCSIGTPTLGTENFPTSTEAPKEVAESYILFSSLWKLLFDLGITSSIGEKEKLTEMQDFVHSGYQPQDGISKSWWHKLVLDLVTEIVQTQSSSGMQKHNQEGYLEAEELGKIIAEKIKKWTKQFRDGSNTIRFDDSDLRHPDDEWRSYEQEKKEVGVEIVDAILEEEINAEFVIVMTGFC